jgi:Tol biopolymer transport system component/predicted Ser/Thr protein kinase
MALVAGTRLGPYEILSPLGAGGMGEVYRANDTRLDRTVAIKVLNSSLVATPDLKARFEREARTISQLNHPNICTLHDVGHEGGTDFLVMEFIEGESLADRLRKGPLPLDQLLKIGIETADALDTAHRAGIVHRDLKPGNVMLTKTGAKLLDFGLAKPLSAVAAASSSASAPSFTAAATLSSPTPLASPFTTHGSMVGTIQYMSPEQIEGREADARSDIFAFGAMLYEMATRKRAFAGKSQIKVASAILEDEPQPIRELQPSIAPAIERVLATCLAKKPDERFQCASDLKLQLKWIAEAPAETAPGGEARRSVSVWQRALPWVGMAVLLVVAVATTLAVQKWRAPKPHLVALTLPLKDVDSRYGMTLSADGRFFAYPNMNGDRRVLAIHSMESGADITYPNAAAPITPAWSPDGRFVFFETLGKYRKLDVSSGAAYDIGEAAARYRGAAWMPNGTILLGGNNQGIVEIGASGGKVETVIKPDGVSIYRWPVLVDANHFLFNMIVAGGGTRVMLASLDGKSVREIAIGADGSTGYSDGYVLFTHGDALLARSLKLDGTVGEPIHITDHVRSASPGARSGFVAAQDGTIVYETGEAGSQELLLLDAAGKPSALPLGRAAFNNPRFSPDGRLLAYNVPDNAGNQDIWIYNLALKQTTRFSLGGTNSDAVWSPDGKQIAYTRQVQGAYEIVARPANGAQGERVLVHDTYPMFGRDWSSDGRFFMFDRFLSGGVAAWKVPLVAGGAASEYIGGGFNKHAERISPDGKWIIYQSNESGQAQVYLESFPERTGKWQVSTAGGLQPRWAGDGRRIYFLSPEDKLMAAEIAFSAAGPQVTKVTERFAVPPSLIAGGNPLDVTRDGSHFILNSRKQDAVSTWNVLLNWTAAVKR